MDRWIDGQRMNKVLQSRMSNSTPSPQPQHKHACKQKVQLNYTNTYLQKGIVERGEMNQEKRLLLQPVDDYKYNE